MAGFGADNERNKNGGINMKMTYLQESSIRDINGNCRCPYCGKYRKRADFPDQSSAEVLTADGVEVRMHVAAMCQVCMGET